MKKKIKEELELLYSFVVAPENEGFAFSLSQSHDRIEYLEKLLKKEDVDEKGD